MRKARFTEHQIIAVIKSGDRLHLHNRNLIFILALEAVQLLRRFCADYPFGHRFS
jgi:hypothetical protein